ncbi:MAG: glycogen synthase GlgA [Ruminococcaceae bacterium]|nr:glycogen synthase GlgA [Oscillospiraceae bacterium]
MKKILFVGAEVMPFAATGGLGDVMGSLPAAIKAKEKNNADVRVVMPLYSTIKDEWRAQMQDEAVFYVPLAWRNQYCGVKSLVKDGVKYYFIDNEYYFKRSGMLYGYFDDGERYAYFCKAVMEMLVHLEFYPDVIQANDWQAAMTVVYLNTKYRYIEGLADTKTVYTIHNIEYQGKFDFAILGDVFDLGPEYYSLMRYDDCINLMKAAIECADKVSTVSERYAEEIKTHEYSHGLSHILYRNAHKLTGILNGIDYNYYNPAKDNVLVKNYDRRGVIKGKAENKMVLQREYGLPERADVPMLAIISRLATHKGLDLVRDIADNVVKNNDVQFVILGKGEPQYEVFFSELESRYPDKVRALLTYDRDLSKKIYAACDIFVMPSKSEPCGLSQMIASRYGAVPVVRETGGLADSIKGYWIDGDEIKGNGFTFANYSSWELEDRINAALALYADKAQYKKFVSKIMGTDFSWSVSAGKYMEMFDSL